MDKVDSQPHSRQSFMHEVPSHTRSTRRALLYKRCALQHKDGIPCRAECSSTKLLLRLSQPPNNDSTTKP
eukprot:1158867-Pelagomonas_calceolata.AAC.27